jgi:uncharacterized protein (UPF0335 family)
MSNFTLKEAAKQIAALEAQRADALLEMKALYDAAKHYGYSVKALRSAIRVHSMTPEKRAEHAHRRRQDTDRSKSCVPRAVAESAECSRMTDFPFVFRWRIAGRHGQRCQIIGKSLYGVRVVFEDGWITNVSRQALRHAAKVTAPEPQRSLEPVSVGAVGEP